MEKEENLKQSIKYIVYITINKVNKKIYVGVHKNYSKKFDGYLGCGVKTTKPSSYKQSKTLFQRAVNKYGVDKFIRITLFEYDTAEEAFKKEEEIITIDFLKRPDVYNTALGGGLPPESKKTPIHQYTMDGEYINSYDSISEAGQKIGIKTASIGNSITKGIACHKFLWSYEKVEKLPKRTGVTYPRKIGVYLPDGRLIKVYDTVTSCKKDYCGCTHVLAGTRKTCKGLFFKYIN